MNVGNSVRSARSAGNCAIFFWSALVPREIEQKVLGGIVEGLLIDAVNDPLADPVFPGVGINGAHGFQLLEVPQDGFVVGAYAAANIAGGSALWVLPQVTQDFGSQWVDAKNRDHGLGAFWDRGCGADIFRHPFILSHRHPSDFQCRIKYDTLLESIRIDLTLGGFCE